MGIKGLSITLLIAAITSISAVAQNASYQRIVVDSPSESTIISLLEAGIDLQCAAGKVLDESGNVLAIELDLSDAEIAMVEDLGLDFDVEISDLDQYYANRSLLNAPVEDVIIAPENFYVNEVGVNGGFFTYDQIVQHLDDMRLLYPTLVSPKLSIGNTVEGRPIYSVKISDNPIFDENEPEVFYNAVHHAREPMSVAQLIYFMWYVLENYENDDRIRGILDNTELFFVPVINVDGYVYNENTNPAGGGNWRKNRRLNAGGSRGVDLNRNYSHQWAFNNQGSSPNPSASTYRGPNAFSEPESRAIRDFVAGRNFKLAFNYHSAARLFIHPWSYDPVGVVADPKFNSLSEFFSEENNFDFGPGSLVLYQNNGNAYDWMYAQHGVYAYTVETGGSGFWPHPSEIISASEDMLESNLRMSELGGVFGRLQNTTEVFQTIPGSTIDIDYELTALGISEGLLEVRTEIIYGEVQGICADQVYELDHGQTVSNSCSIEILSSAVDGDVIEVEITLFNDNREIQSFVAPFIVREPGLALNILAPSSGTFPVGTDFEVRTRILSNLGVNNPSLFVDGQNRGTLQALSPGSDIYTINLTNLSDGQHYLVVRAEDDLGYEKFSQTEIVYLGSGSQGAFQENSGIVVFEAESYSENLTRGNDSWQLSTSIPAYGGSGFMVTGPNNGTKVTSGYAGTVSELKYEVNFSSPGTYYLWYRGFGTDTGENSVHFGLNGEEIPSLQDVGFANYGSFVWTSLIDNGSRASVQISEAGLHEINMWLREDGTRVDRILLTKDPSYQPGFIGPSESPKQAGEIAFQAKVILSGAFSNGVMRTALSSAGLVPENQPYPDANLVKVLPGYFSQRDDIVDWIYYELRASTSSASAVASGAALLTKDGNVLDPYGNPELRVFGLDPGNYFLVIGHRNHLAIMSAGPWAMSPEDPPFIDFSSDLSQSFSGGSPAMTELADGSFGLFGGDANQDRKVSYSGANNDRVEVLNILNDPSPFSFVNGYLAQDFNLDGRVSYSGGNNDRVVLINSTGGPSPFDTKVSQVPQ